jgi:hypothetical protein
MKRTIYDCWSCCHRNSNNPYGIDYCEVHDTRCSFAHDDCDNFEPTANDSDLQPQPRCRPTLTACYLLAIVIALLLGLLLMGCTTTKYVTVPEVHEHWHHSTDTIVKTDSVIDHQTTIIREVDSVTMAQYGIRMSALQMAWLIQTDRLQRELSRMQESRTDTVTVHDSIPYPVEVVKEVPRELSWWQQALMHTGGIAILLLIVFAAVKVIQRMAL